MQEELVLSTCKGIAGWRPPWFRMFGGGLFFPKKANITSEIKNQIAGVAKRVREGCSRVIVLDRRSRSSELRCCDNGMVAVDVFYSAKGDYSRREYFANPSFVCDRCFRCLGPGDYDPPMI
jgi:hypothetical protein